MRQKYGYGWNVEIIVDDDGHLNIYVENDDKTTIHQVDSDQGDGINGEQYAIRMTTEQLEREYQEEYGD